MTRQQVLDCLKSGKLTPEFVADWAQDKVPEEKLGQLITIVIQQGLIPPAMFPDMIDKYKINQVLSPIGEHITWY